MIFFTEGDVIFRLRLRHPRFAVFKYGFTSASLPETKSNTVNNPVTPSPPMGARE